MAGPAIRRSFAQSLLVDWAAISTRDGLDVALRSATVVPGGQRSGLVDPSGKRTATGVVRRGRRPMVLGQETGTFSTNGHASADHARFIGRLVRKRDGRLAPFDRSRIAH